MEWTKISCWFVVIAAVVLLQSSPSEQKPVPNHPYPYHGYQPFGPLYLPPVQEGITVLVFTPDLPRLPNWSHGGPLPDYDHPLFYPGDDGDYDGEGFLYIPPRQDDVPQYPPYEEGVKQDGVAGGDKGDEVPVGPQGEGDVKKVDDDEGVTVVMGDIVPRDEVLSTGEGGDSAGKGMEKEGDDGVTMEDKMDEVVKEDGEEEVKEEEKEKSKEAVKEDEKGDDTEEGNDEKGDDKEKVKEEEKEVKEDKSEEDIKKEEKEEESSKDEVKEDEKEDEKKEDEVKEDEKEDDKDDKKEESKPDTDEETTEEVTESETKEDSTESSEESSTDETTEKGAVTEAEGPKRGDQAGAGATESPEQNKLSSEDDETTQTPDLDIRHSEK